MLSDAKKVFERLSELIERLSDLKLAMIILRALKNELRIIFNLQVS
jgi:hypothetical protein